MRCRRAPWLGLVVTSVVVLALPGCGGDNTPSQTTAPGDEPSTETKVLEAGTAVLQDKEPLDALNVYMDGFHFYSGNMQAQMEAHHYCSILNEDVHQCVIFDGNGRDAKMMGIEYIVSGRLFEQFAEEEKKLWHSHVYEVKSGTLIAPGVPQQAEHEFMEKMIGTYGKTWHTWHMDDELSLPVGHPMLMMAFTQDGQADPAMIAARDERFDVSSAEKREDRATIAAPPIIAGADSWQHGEALQLSIGPVAAGKASPHRAQEK
jgi:hypothetical protein